MTASTASKINRVHSLHERDRMAGIEQLGQLSGSDAARELVQLFQDCQWRNTKFQILLELARHPHSRGLEFLFSVVKQSADLPMAEAAVRALGKSRNRLAARFLQNLYLQGSEVLRPTVVGALGEIPDRSLHDRFLNDLKLARSDQGLFRRNLVLTLGEIKSQQALPLFREIIETEENKDIVLSALISYGKVARRVEDLASWSTRFEKDLLEKQIFLGVRSQVAARSQWTVEDYLERLFASSAPHPTLPFELLNFSPDDVKTGLMLFNRKEHWARLLGVLSRLAWPEVSGWYADFFDWKKLSTEEKILLLASLSHHSGPAVSQILWDHRDWQAFRDPELLASWAKAAAYSSESSRLFIDLFKEEGFKNLEGPAKIEVLNSFFEFALTMQPLKAEMKAISDCVEGLMSREKDRPVLGRLIRGAAAAHLGSGTITQRVQELFEDPAIKPSCYVYFENCPSRGSLKILEAQVAVRGTDGWNSVISYLRALAIQEQVRFSPGILALLKQCLKAEDPEPAFYALRLLSRHYHGDLTPEVFDCLRREEKVQLMAVIALKSSGDEKAADQVAPLLYSESPAVAGRVLDSLTALPGLRAKRVVIDYFSAEADDLEVVDKVIRSFDVKGIESDYFYKTVAKVIERLVHHPRKEELLGFMERIKSAEAEKQVLKALQNEKILAIDQRLSGEIPHFSRLDEVIKAALRSAEVPYFEPDYFNESVDKSFAVLGYCKAADLFLEREIGQKLLFPRLERSLHEFQNALYVLGLQDEYPHPEKLLLALSVNREFSVESLPVHKISLIAKDILTGKILNERFRTIDGLRAWAVILLLFCRDLKGVNGGKALLKFPRFSEAEILSLAKKLMLLQEIRNPAAHRQTGVNLKTITEVRRAVLELLSKILK